MLPLATVPITAAGRKPEQNFVKRRWAVGERALLFYTLYCSLGGRAEGECLELGTGKVT